MPCIQYMTKTFRGDALRIIELANEICEDYQAQGFDLTLRQLYYQFVSRDLIANKDSEYKRLGSIINDARMCGLLDWDYIVDRTRNLRSNPHWSNPASIINSAANSYAVDKWADQDKHVEVWIEKDALIGVIEGVCARNDVAYFSCRGYTSQSEVWHAGQRLISKVQEGKRPVILHLGDHDPSGIDMSRDIEDRLTTFMDGGQMDEGNWSNEECGYKLEVRRIALNYDQIRQYNPPPNPAKLQDARAEKYVRRYGKDSWELDALEPRVIVDLIQDNIDRLRDNEKWQLIRDKELDDRNLLISMAANWPEVEGFVAGIEGGR